MVLAGMKKRIRFSTAFKIRSLILDFLSSKKSENRGVPWRELRRLSAYSISRPKLFPKFVGHHVFYKQNLCPTGAFFGDYGFGITKCFLFQSFETTIWTSTPLAQLLSNFVTTPAIRSYISRRHYTTKDEEAGEICVQGSDYGETRMIKTENHNVNFILVTKWPAKLLCRCFKSYLISRRILYPH